MDQTGDGQPTEDARPYLPPTEIARPHPPARAGPAYGPTQAGPAYEPTHAGPPYEPTQAGPPYRPAHAGSADNPTVAGPSYTPTHARPAGQPPAYQPAQDGPGGPAGPPQELVRYGPGVPATPPTRAAQTAERIWRTGRPEEPARRPRRWRRLAGTALTVILLAASGVVLYLRFHHPPFHVIGVKITQKIPTACGVNVTGQISTNGAAGTVSYQWLFLPDRRSPQPLSQSVVAGQDVVYVTVAVQGSGHGSASRTVTLQVLGPDRRADTTPVVLQC